MKGLDDKTPDPRKLAQDSLSDYQLTSEVFGAIYEVDLGAASLKILASSQEDDIYVVMRIMIDTTLVTFMPKALLQDYHILPLNLDLKLRLLKQKPLKLI